MIHSFELCLKKTTRTAHPGRAVKENGFWLYSCYEKKHGICAIEIILLFLFLIARQTILSIINRQSLIVNT